jgi:hypothetical protein
MLRDNTPDQYYARVYRYTAGRDNDHEVYPEVLHSDNKDEEDDQAYYRRFPHSAFAGPREEDELGRRSIMLPSMEGPSAA